MRALALLLAIAGVGAAWWRGRDAGELEVELEDLAGMTPQASELYEISREPNVAAGLAAIRYGEGTADDAGYYRMFGGELVAHLADHPRRAVTRAMRIRTPDGDTATKPITSTAAGAYQFLERTWDECARALELPDFSPASQDIAAVYLIRRRGVLEDLRAGRLEAALPKMAREWASLPGSPYGQPLKTFEQIARVYSSAGGIIT